MSPTTIPGNFVLQSPAANDPLLDHNTQPSLDLQFATSKTLDDRVSGEPLVDHQRDVSSGKSAGTYVDSTGVIRTSKVNLLTYSEEFDDNAWIKTNVVPDTTVAAPNGALSAQKIKENSTTNSLHSVNISTATLMNGVYTFSVYAKASERSIIALNFTFANGTFSTSDSRAWFNLSNGTVGTTLNASDATIDPVGSSGWYRCTLVSGSFSSANRKVLVATSIADGSVTHNGDGTSGIYLWGAQLEEGSTASTYIKTTNLPSAAPRFDHDPTTNASLGLLVEESRTNKIPYSEDFTNTYWTTQNGVTDLNTNGVLNPKGDQAYLYTANSGSARKRLITANTTPGAVSFVFSVYIKSAGARYVQLLWAPTGFDYCNFDLVAGTPGTKGSGISNPKITDVGDGWYRLSMYVQNTTPTQVFSILAVDSASAAFAASATYKGEAFYLFGFHVEEGTFPTSYIPTSGSTVTRAADVASITGSNFSRWYEQSEGTYYAQASKLGINPSLQQTILTSEIFNTRYPEFSFRPASESPAGAARVYGTNLSVTSTVALDSAKFAAAYEDGVGATSVINGIYQGSNTVDPIGSTRSSIVMGNYANSFRLNGHIARLTYYPYRLPDATLQEITS